MPIYQTYRTLPARPYKPTEAKPKRFKLKQFFVISLVLLLATAVISAGLSRNADQHAAAETAWRQHQKAIFAAEVNKLIADNPQIKLSVSASAVDNDQIQSLGQTEAIDAASTAKVLTGAYYAKQVEAGRFSLNQTIGGKSARLQLQLMLQQSDDTAWLLLNDKLGHANLEQYAHSLGLDSYQSDTNIISAADLTKLLKALATGSLLNANHTNLLLSYMQHTNYEDFITPALPSGYSIYHKVGIDEDYVNDTAIISSPDGRAFVLSIMSDGQGTYEWQNRSTLIQQIATDAIKAYLQ